jgi:hypothetical protein
MPYHVYVVELRPHGPKDLRDRRHVYVGSSHLPPDERFRHHLHGLRASRHVRRHGIRLRPELAPDVPFATRDEAKRAEHRTARNLSRNGYVVWGSCSSKLVPDCTL